MAPQITNFVEEYLDRMRRDEAERTGIDPSIIQESPLPFDLLLLRPVPWWKRAIDVLGALFALVVFMPLAVVIGLAIKFGSSGPIIFKQERGGHGGKPFQLYKFRTMVEDAEEQKAALLHLNERHGPAFKMKADPRITRVGAILRKTSLDELPQFLNVLKGEMSLVGPRPLPLSEDMGVEYWHRYRQLVKPGITCIWQVTSRDESEFDDWMRLDVQYIRNFSLWLDLKLIFFTLPAVLLRRGAH